MRLSIKWCIILGSFFLVWGTHLIIMPSSYISSERVLTSHVQDIMQNIVDLTLEQSNNHLNKAKSAANLAKQLLSADVVRSDISGVSSLERYFFNQLSIYPHLSGIYFATLSGDFFFVSRTNKKIENGFRTKIIRNDAKGNRQVDLMWRDSNYNKIAEETDPKDTYDPRKRPWFTEVMKERDVIWTSPYIFYSSQKPGITIAGPSFGKDNLLKGIVGVDIEIAELSTFISKLRVGKSGQAFMLNRNGDVIAYRDLQKLVIRNEDSSSFRLPKVSEVGSNIVKNAFQSIEWQYDGEGFLKLKEPVFTSFMIKKKKYISIFSPFPDERLPWIVAVYIPEQDYLKEIRTNRLFNTIATVIISLLASLLGLSLAKKIVTPIQNLQSSAKAIEQNDMESSFQTDSIFTELQETANTFSRMKKSLIVYEDTLVEKEAIYRAITDTANDAIIMMDEQQLISYWNPAAQRMFGYTNSEIIGKNLHQTLAPSSYFPKYSKGLEQFHNGENGPIVGKTHEFSAVNKDGVEFPVEMSISKLKINDNWHALAIMRDITERMNNEQVKKRLAHDLHDGIGGNLSNIKLLSEMLKAKTDDVQLQEALATIADISNDCISETRNYMGALENKDLDWKSLIDELQLYCVRVAASHQVTLSVTSEVAENATLPNTFLYMSLFRMVKEAVNNAVKHSGALNIWLEFEISQSEFNCLIKDNGNGLAPKPGSGRGLLSMQTRASQLGGTFDLVGLEGVTVTIKMPIAHANKSAHI